MPLGEQTTYIHAGELRPDLNGDGKVCPVDHLWFEEGEETDGGSVSVHLHSFLQFIVLCQDNRIVVLAFSMQVGQHIPSVIPSLVLSQPPG